MKTKLNFLSKLVILFLMVTSTAFSQGQIINTIGPGGFFQIKDATNNYFVVAGTGQVRILRDIRLENTTSSNLGVMYKGSDRFLHNFEQSNTFLGINAGNFTMNSLAIANTGIGFNALQSNVNGTENTAVGDKSLFQNTTGDQNTAVGENALYNNQFGDSNTAIGKSTLINIISSHSNVALGSLSGTQITSGNRNTILGTRSGTSIVTGSNNICIGYDAEVPNSFTSNNQIRMGNSAIQYAGIQVGWNITSDRKLKSNILNSNLGLNFISKLRPVGYTRNNDEMQKTEYGFIAQEVEDVLKESGADNTGMISIDDKGGYEMRYNDLLAPMVKSIQELKAENDLLKKNNEKLAAEVVSFKSMSEKMNLQSEKSKIESIELKNKNAEMNQRLSKLEETQNILVNELKKSKLEVKVIGHVKGDQK